VSCVKYNNIIDVEYAPVDPEALPVSLAEFKQHLLLQFDTEGSYEFNDDDTELTIILKAATAAIEKYTGQLLRPCTVQAVLRNEKGDQALPYGPVTAFTVLTDCDGNDIDAEDYRLTGLSFKCLAKPCYAEMTASYAAGYTTSTVPADLNEAVKHQGAFLYNNRGDQSQQYAATDLSVSPSARNLAKPHRRVVWLL